MVSKGIQKHLEAKKLIRESKPYNVYASGSEAQNFGYLIFMLRGEPSLQVEFLKAIGGK